MIKELISPYQANAFCDVILYKIVQNSLSSELTEDLWEAFNNAFEIYWNAEAGIGGLVGMDYMFEFIRWRLMNDKVLIPDHILYFIVEAVWNFIDQIPGAIIHD